MPQKKNNIKKKRKRNNIKIKIKIIKYEKYRKINNSKYYKYI